MKFSDQWTYVDQKDYAKAECRQWKLRHNFVLVDNVMPTESKPTPHYMYQYESVTIRFLFEPRYLVDPQQHASSSNAQQNQQHTYAQLSTQQNYQPTINTCHTHNHYYQQQPQDFLLISTLTNTTHQPIMHIPKHLTNNETNIDYKTP